VPVLKINCIHVIRTNPFVHSRANIITVQGNEIECQVLLRGNFVSCNVFSDYSTCIDGFWLENLKKRDHLNL
jgi:hypothetical protein